MVGELAFSFDLIRGFNVVLLCACIFLANLLQ
jgi:hypothetical protein